MSEKKWNPGDKVKLASGGPVMTVKSAHEGAYTGILEVVCQWIDSSGNLQEGKFPPESLEQVN